MYFNKIIIVLCQIHCVFFLCNGFGHFCNIFFMFYKIFWIPLIFNIINIWVISFHCNTNPNHIQLESIGFNALNWIFQNMAITKSTDLITKIGPNYEVLCIGFCGSWTTAWYLVVIHLLRFMYVSIIQTPIRHHQESFQSLLHNELTQNHIVANGQFLLNTFFLLLI